MAGGAVEIGYSALAADLSRATPSVLALDGAPWVDWERVVGSLRDALGAAGIHLREQDVRAYSASWEEIQLRTTPPPASDDPAFAPLSEASMESLFRELPGRLTPSPGAQCTLVFGPGSALVPHDRLWYADLPKRLGAQAVMAGRAANLGQPPGERATERRLYFVDWPMLDRHKGVWAGRWDRYLDCTDPARLLSLDGEALRRSLQELAEGPFRARPVFLPGSWGGQWMRRRLGIPTEAPNLAWSYELITPEGGILMGADDPCEMGFEVLMALAGPQVVGHDVSRRFGASFPIRFDYLDTFEGGNLSVHCHPLPAYMKDVFGWPYTQHESYYVMATRPGARIFLGLQEGADLEAFRAGAEEAELRGAPLEVDRCVQSVAARLHQLYLIPAGTPHASGEGNVVLEKSSTPYLYSLRFYDWLRPDLDGELRPVHLRHAFGNLDRSRVGGAVPARLIQRPRVLRRAPGMVELVLGTLPELFFAVHRLDFDDQAEDDTAGRFHVLNLVEGEEVLVETERRSHPLAYAETIVVPASVGRYRLQGRGGTPCKVIKAFVR